MCNLIFLTSREIKTTRPSSNTYIHIYRCHLQSFLQPAVKFMQPGHPLMHTYCTCHAQRPYSLEPAVKFIIRSLSSHAYISYMSYATIFFPPASCEIHHTTGPSRHTYNHVIYNKYNMIVCAKSGKDWYF